MKGKLLIVVLTLSLAVNVSAVATIGYHYWRNACLTPSAPCPLNRGRPSSLSGSRSFPRATGKNGGAGRLVSPPPHGARSGGRSQEKPPDRLLWGRNQIDLPRTEAIRKEIAGFQDEIQKEVITHIAESKKIMNPEQQKRFIELLRTSANHGQLNSPFSMNGGNH